MKLVLFLFIPFFLLASEPLPFNLKYPTVTKSSKIKQESYDKFEVYVKGKGYISRYGHTFKQEFRHPKIEGDYKEIIKSFIAKSLYIPRNTITKNNTAEFNANGKTYWIKLSISKDHYSYLLLEVKPYAKTVTLDEDKPYSVTPKYHKRYGKADFPKNIAIAHVEGYGVSRASYKDYDELSFYYKRGSTLHKGKYWKIDFERIEKDPNSGRYSVAHDYKAQLLKLGAEILKDEDNTIHFKLHYKGSTNIILLSTYNTTFSLKIIQEEAFTQVLILTPDAIKTELDKTGKITLDGIYFDFNKASLKPESTKAILSAVALMQRYKDLVLSVHGHTDDKGSDSYNAKLSSERAASVMNAIIEQGIEASRLTSKGHGETNPIASNATEEGRAQNRRVELHKERGGDERSVITIDFIKPIENSVVSENRTYSKSDLGVRYTKPYSEIKHYEKYIGTQKMISYRVMKEGKVNKNFSRKAIIKNYENVLELYNAKIIGEYSSNLYFEISDRGDGKRVYGVIEAYTGSYTIRFLIEKHHHK